MIQGFVCILKLKIPALVIRLLEETEETWLINNSEYFNIYSPLATFTISVVVLVVFLIAFSPTFGTIPSAGIGNCHPIDYTDTSCYSSSRSAGGHSFRPFECIPSWRRRIRTRKAKQIVCDYRIGVLVLTLTISHLEVAKDLLTFVGWAQSSRPWILRQKWVRCSIAGFLD